MARVDIYTTPWCPYCLRAKVLLRAKGVSYHEIDVSDDLGKRREMVERSGRVTVPQIFINGQGIGGHDDMVALDRQGRLDPLLTMNSAGATHTADAGRKTEGRSQVPSSAIPVAALEM